MISLLFNYCCVCVKNMQKRYTEQLVSNLQLYGHWVSQRVRLNCSVIFDFIALGGNELFVIGQVIAVVVRDFSPKFLQYTYLYRKRWPVYRRERQEDRTEFVWLTPTLLYRLEARAYMLNYTVCLLITIVDKRSNVTFRNFASEFLRDVEGTFFPRSCS